MSNPIVDRIAQYALSSVFSGRREKNAEVHLTRAELKAVLLAAAQLGFEYGEKAANGAQS